MSLFHILLSTIIISIIISSKLLKHHLRVKPPTEADYAKRLLPATINLCPSLTHARLNKQALIFLKVKLILPTSSYSN